LGNKNISFSMKGKPRRKRKKGADRGGVLIFEKGEKATRNVEPGEVKGGGLNTRLNHHANARRRGVAGEERGTV